MKKRNPDEHMTETSMLGIDIGLSEAEKNDLEEMIGQFQKEREQGEPQLTLENLQHQIDVINERMANLSNLFLNLDRRIKPLYETIRLTYQKSEVLNQRINTLIDSIRMGEPR